MKSNSKFWYKARRFEFWPWYLLYIPLLPVYVFGVLYTRKLLYFTAVNPSIDMGGFFGESKHDILDLIPKEFKVIGVRITEPLSDIQFCKLLEQHELVFPVIAKPNVGERGMGVTIVYNMADLQRYANEYQDFLVQEYVDYPIEIGLLFTQLPNSENGKVTSLTQKEFLSVVGDGSSTVGELLLAHTRSSIYYSVVEKQFGEKLSIVPKKGELFIIHTIGNHTKGTQFLDFNHKITAALNQTFTALNKEVDGVYYGRYDLKVPTYDDLDEGKNIKIFELNGVSSEPGHMYDQPHALLAYKVLAKHWWILVKIAQQNIKKGVKTTPLSNFLKTVKGHFLG